MSNFMFQFKLNIRKTFQLTITMKLMWKNIIIIITINKKNKMKHLNDVTSKSNICLVFDDLLTHILLN